MDTRGQQNDARNFKPGHASAIKLPQQAPTWAIAAVVVILLIIIPYAMLSGDGSSSSSLRGDGPKSIPPRLKFAIITDLDHDSKDKEAAAKGKPSWHSTLKYAELVRDSSGQFSVEWGTDFQLETGHGEKGRGMELSELIKYDGKLYTCDDRSGILFEVVGYDPSAPGGPQPVAYPRHIMMEGSGDTDKGFKCEWMAEKDGLMLVGSFGKEYTDNDGNILNRNNMWVKVFTPDGRLSHVDWTSNYAAMRRQLGYEHPAYLLHETALWSAKRQQWVFLPRRMSHEKYDDTVDEKKGANTVITCSRDFSNIRSFKVGTLTPERGFSSAKFVPGSSEHVVVALKSEENAALGTQGSYITVFDMDGNVLLEETAIPGAHKYEGIEFV